MDIVQTWGGSGAAKPFIEKRYGHVFRGEGGRRTSSKVVSCKKVFGGVPLEVLCVKIIYILHALSEKFHSSIYQKLILYFKLFVSKCPNYGIGRGGRSQPSLSVQTFCVHTCLMGGSAEFWTMSKIWYFFFFDGSRS